MKSSSKPNLPTGPFACNKHSLLLLVSIRGIILKAMFCFNEIYIEKMLVDLKYECTKFTRYWVRKVKLNVNKKITRRPEHMNVHFKMSQLKILPKNINYFFLILLCYCRFWLSKSYNIKLMWCKLMHFESQPSFSL